MGYYNKYIVTKLMNIIKYGRPPNLSIYPNLQI